MEENKYYIPALNELVYGMDIEIKNTRDKFFMEAVEIDNWFKTTVNFGVLGNFENLQKLVSDKQLRIKYFNIKDIEKCGFTKGGRNFYNRDKIEVDIEEFPWLTIYDNTVYACVFRGKVVNKTEFEKILKMIEEV